MARPASKAVGGYYPTPPSLVPAIAALLELPAVVTDEDGDPEERSFAIVDPCAADGAAVFALSREIAKGRADLKIRHYVAELEATRSAALKSARGSDTTVARGDAFRIRFETERDRRSASLVFLNPPYDEGELETRWLERFKDALVTGGVLVFIVPVGALAPAASTLARSFENLACFRFPSEEYLAFKQVVLLGRRREMLLHPDPALTGQLDAWVAAPDTIPVLPLAGPAVHTVPLFEHAETGFSTWEITPLDVIALAKSVRPWRRTDRRGTLQLIPGVLPAEGVRALDAQTFPVAMPLGEGHVPAALGCGVMNGARFSPDDPASGLPEVYAKAVFRKRWKTADRRKDEYGNVVGEVQVQQPELRMTVLDLATSTFHTPRSSAERTDALYLPEMTAADILFRYQRAFRAVIERRCPALHDPKEPGHALALPALPRRLFTAQAEVTRAVVKLLLTERAALVLGEVGVGKSTVTLATAATLGARRIVIVCPPHLLDSWKDQAKAVLPGARTLVLVDVADVDGFAAATDEGVVIAILAQTSGKLRHAWAGVGDADAKPVHLAESPETIEIRAHRAAFVEGAFPRRCPRCGEVPKEAPDELAKTRARCTSKPLVVKGALGRLALSLATVLIPVFADAATVAELFPEYGRARLVRRAAFALERDKGLRARNFATQVRERRFGPIIAALLSLAIEGTKNGRPPADMHVAREPLLELLAAAPDVGTIAHAVRSLYVSSLEDRAWYGTGAEQRTFARKLMLLLPPGGDAQAELARELETHSTNDERYGTGGWERWRNKVQDLVQGRSGHNRATADYSSIDIKEGVLHLGKYPVGSAALAKSALETLKSHGGIGEGPSCNEFLYAAIPKPRRVPLAKYLAKRYPGLVDLAVIDECHECANQDSAQAQAMAKFMGTRMLLLTGSLSNGYAVGLFAILWTISRRFRDEFSRDAVNDFGRTYGYERRYVDYRDKESGEVVTFGANSDRVERRRSMGWAPGVLPSLILKHVLPISVVLHMDDLKVDLPPRTEAVELVEPGHELGRRVQALRGALVAQIKADRWGSLAGKLFGQMAEEWSSADRASEGIGNTPDGIFRVTYPESVGGGLVVELPPMPKDEVLPKERKLVDLVRSELAEGRNVLVFAWHSDCGLFERLARLLERELDLRCPILHADKVPAKKREAWINAEILAKKRRVLLVNPVAVGTGLNVLTHFSTIIWFQPPGCAPKALRQAEGRVHRIGQTKPTRVYWLLYKGTSQEILHRLLLLKVAESVALDGLDPASALEASGVGTQEGMSGFDVGRAIFEAVRDERFLPPVPAPEAPAPALVALPVIVPIAARPAPAVEPAPLPVLPLHIIEKTVGPAKKSVQLTWSF